MLLSIYQGLVGICFCYQATSQVTPARVALSSGAQVFPSEMSGISVRPTVFLLNYRWNLPLDVLSLLVTMRKAMSRAIHRRIPQSQIFCLLQLDNGDCGYSNSRRLMEGHDVGAWLCLVCPGLIATRQMQNAKAAYFLGRMRLHVDDMSSRP